jgi:CBS domain-containing protein
MCPEKGLNTDKSVIEELRHLQIFRQISNVDLKSMLDCLEQRHYEMGKVLFQTGEPYGKSIYILYRGRVGMWGPQGEKYEVDPGEILGLSNYLDGLPYVFTAIALTPISLLVAKETEHQQLERLGPVLNRLLNRLVAHQIRTQQTTKQSFVGSMTRPAKTAMKTPLATCGPDVSLAQAYKTMDERKIGSLVVTGQDGELLGVLTFAGLSEAVLVRGAAPEDNVMKVAREIAYTVSSDTPLWEVEEIQHRNALKYVIVTEGNRPLGMISQTDILHNLLAQRGGVRDEVRSINSFSGLVKFAKRLLSIATEARERNHYASTAVRIISEFHLALQRRCTELTLQEMAKNGYGNAPVSFALLIMGSGGRREMMLNPHQDNAIIIADSYNNLDEKNLGWFIKFAKLLNQHLEEIGYALCVDNIMAKSPLFHKTLEQWCQHISDVTTTPTKEAAHWLRTLMDLDTLYGDRGLTEALRGHVLAELKKKPRLLRMMVEDNAGWRPPLGFFNKLIPMGFFNTKEGAKSKGKIDIKCNGLSILADIVRIYALRAEIRNCNTLERLLGLARQGELSVEYANSIKAAYEALMQMLLTHQIHQAERGRRLDKLIKPERLTAVDHEILRMSMCVIKGFQEKLQASFK